MCFVAKFLGGTVGVVEGSLCVCSWDWDRKLECAAERRKGRCLAKRNRSESLACWKDRILKGYWWIYVFYGRVEGRLLGFWIVCDLRLYFDILVRVNLEISPKVNIWENELEREVPRKRRIRRKRQIWRKLYIANLKKFSQRWTFERMSSWN